jgi:hypothetical protein
MGSVCVGIGGGPLGMPTERLATSPVAPAVCCAGCVAGPSSVVRADMTLACSGSGNAGRFAPPLAALHVVVPTLAVTGVPTGCPLSAVAEQFHPAADADADTASTLAAIATTTNQSILRTRDLQCGTRIRTPTTRGEESSGFPACAGK